MCYLSVTISVYEKLFRIKKVVLAYLHLVLRTSEAGISLWAQEKLGLDGVQRLQ